MSDALWGVIVGGTIASIGPLINLFFNYHKYKKEAKIKYFQSKRDRFEKQIDETLETLSDGMKNDSYPADMLSDINMLFSKEVIDTYDTMALEKDRTASKMRQHFAKIAFAMKKELSEIDKKIEKQLGI